MVEQTQPTSKNPSLEVMTDTRKPVVYQDIQAIEDLVTLVNAQPDNPRETRGNWDRARAFLTKVKDAAERDLPQFPIRQPLRFNPIVTEDRPYDERIVYLQENGRLTHNLRGTSDFLSLFTALNEGNLHLLREVEVVDEAEKEEEVEALRWEGLDSHILDQAASTAYRACMVGPRWQPWEQISQNAKDQWYRVVRDVVTVIEGETGKPIHELPPFNLRILDKASEVSFETYASANLRDGLDGTREAQAQWRKGVSRLLGELYDLIARASRDSLRSLLEGGERS